MNWGGPEFVLAIIAMAMFAGVMKTAIRAKHGLPDHSGDCNKRSRRDRTRVADESSALIDGLHSENKRLAGRVEAMEDRLIVLEKIVTDRSYTLSREIEALRSDAGVPLGVDKREKA